MYTKIKDKRQNGLQCVCLKEEEIVFADTVRYRYGTVRYDDKQDTSTGTVRYGTEMK